MKAIHIPLLHVLIALIIILFGLPMTALAQSEGLSVKPAIIEEKVNPGDTYPFTVTVTNISPADKTFVVSAQDIKGLDDNGLPIVSTDTDGGDYAMSSWITISEPVLTIKAGESKSISFVIQVPQTTAPGAHFAGVFFDANAPTKATTTGASINMKVGTIISMRIAGDVIEEARLREFSTDKFIYSTADVDFTSKVDNLGNVLVRPRGIIDISDMRGKQVATIEVNENASAIFPSSGRTYASKWSYDGFAFGRYQAVLSVSYGDEAKKTVSGTTSFWVLPLNTLAAVIAGLIGLLLMLWIGVRMYIRNQLRSMGMVRAGTADIYAKRYSRSSSRLFIVVLSVVLLCIALLVVLFLMFA